MFEKFIQKIEKFIQKIDAWLWQHGFRIEKIRLVTRVLIMLNLGFLTLSVLALPLSAFFLYFSLASCLMSYSFFDIAQHTQLHFPNGGSQKISFIMILRFLMRLAITLFICVICITALGANPIALFLGLGVPIFTIPIVFIMKK